MGILTGMHSLLRRDTHLELPVKEPVKKKKKKEKERAREYQSRESIQGSSRTVVKMKEAQTNA